MLFADIKRINGILILSIAVMVVGPFSISAAQVSKPTTWTIEAKVTRGTKKPKYEVTASPDAAHGGCIYAKPGADPKHLMICPSDSVNWVGNSNGQKHELVVFVSDQVLTVNGAAVATFGGSDGKPTDTGVVNPQAKKLVEHEWYVAFFDKSSGEMHNDDPKIIIGTGNLMDLVNEVSEKIDQLFTLIPENSYAKKLVENIKELKKNLQ